MHWFVVWLRTGALMGVMMTIFLVAGWVVALTFGGGLITIGIFGTIGLLMNWYSYWYSDAIVLRLYKGQVVDATQAPAVHAMVDELCANASILKPRIAIIPERNPNAFATGRNQKHALLGLTEGLREILDDRELRGVIAHELGHIKNRDMLVSSVAATLAGFITLVGNMAMWRMFFGGGRDHPAQYAILILSAILMPIGAALVQMAVSRTREYHADATGARISRDPQALASALAKIERSVTVRPLKRGTAAQGHLFISNPFRGGLSGLFSTHPQTQDRIQRLEAMVGTV